MGDDDDTTSLWAVSPRPAARPRIPVLVGLRDDLPALFVLRERDTTVGRAETCGLRLSVRGVSREHAKLVMSAAAVSLVDLRARNGTLVNGERIDATTLSEGDEIHFGPLALFRFTRTVVGEVETGSNSVRLEGLTPREAQIAEAVADGLTSAAIATRLGIKPRTVVSHLEHIYSKLEIKSRAELVKYVVRATERAK